MISRNSTATKKNAMIKLLYSYGGVIRPGPTDGKLRYVGGHTRVLSVDRSISFSELMVKFVELCGSSMVLKCKLPDEDLDVLVTVASEDDLRNIIDEYDRLSKDVKITAILFPRESLKKISPVSSSDILCAISSSGTSVSSHSSRFVGHRSSSASSCRLCCRISPALRFQIDAAGKFRSNLEQGKPPIPLNRVASPYDLCTLSSSSSSGVSSATSPSCSAHPQMTPTFSYGWLSTLGNQNDGFKGRNVARPVYPCRGQGNPRPVRAAPVYFTRCR